MSVADVVDALVAHAENVTGLKRVHDDPPDALNQFPSAIVYALRGQMGKRLGRGLCAALESVFVIEIHHSRQVLPQAVAASQVWPDLVFAELQTSELDILYPVEWTAGVLQYGENQHYGIRFEITVRH